MSTKGHRNAQEETGSAITRRSALAAFGAAGAGAAGAAALAGCGGSSSSSSSSSGGVVRIKVWAWYPSFAKVVANFNATHKNIQVDWTNAGTGGDEYTKLQTALKAGKGAPDVVMLELQELPTILLTKHLLDLGKYGANKVKSNYVDWAWKQVSAGDVVYSIPVDAGPMGMLYRKDIFDKYKLEVPTTWDEYKQVAQQLKAKSPTTYITDAGASDAGWLTGLAWQAGARPYTYSFSDLAKVGVNINNAYTKKVFAYWQDMVSSGLADSTSYGTTDFYNGLSSGKYATYICAGWGPGYLLSVAKKTSGKWRAAALPQWTAGGTAQGDFGGSSFAVTDQTDHPQEAATVAMELYGTSQAAWKIGIDEAYLFPTVKSILNWEYFSTKKYDFFGGQAVNPVFTTAANGIGTFNWNPFNDYVAAQTIAAIGKAITAKTSWGTALDTVQATVTAYAKKEGFTVS